MNPTRNALSNRRLAEWKAWASAPGMGDNQALKENYTLSSNKR